MEELLQTISAAVNNNSLVDVLNSAIDEHGALNLSQTTTGVTDSTGQTDISRTSAISAKPPNGNSLSTEANRSSLDMSDVQTNILAGFSQPHVQQLLQQTNIFAQHQQLSELMRGQLLALQDRLHLNFVHQTQLMNQLSQCKDRKLSMQALQIQLQIQQLGFEQQQLVQQIQVQQRHYLMQQGVNTPTSAGLSPTDVQKLWQDAISKANDLSSFATSNVSLTNGLSSPTSAALIAAAQQPRLSTGSDLSLSHLLNASTTSVHPLYQHGICGWPSCEAQCDNFMVFLQHLSVAHQLDDRTTAQCRVQMQVVEQLESQVSKEKLRLQAMMSHLQMKQSPDTTTGHNHNHHFPDTSLNSPMPSPKSTATISPSEPSSALVSPYLSSLSAALPTSLNSSAAPRAVVTPPAHKIVTSSEPLKTVAAAPVTTSSAGFTLTAPTAPQPIRRRVSDKGVLPIAADIARNRDFYKNTDIRPPYTYASLIRQAIMESKEHQLTLNEIYNWFQDTFAYFRRNAATWKNAVRHNLSLHKCFMRVENVKGAVWTVDEIEFYKRRPQRLSNAGVYRGQRASPYADDISASIQALMQGGSDVGIKSHSDGAVFDESGMSDAEMDAYAKEELVDEDDLDMPSGSDAASMNRCKSEPRSRHNSAADDQTAAAGGVKPELTAASHSGDKPQPSDAVNKDKLDDSTLVKLERWRQETLTAEWAKAATKETFLITNDCRSADKPQSPLRFAMNTNLAELSHDGITSGNHSIS